MANVPALIVTTSAPLVDPKRAAEIARAVGDSFRIATSDAIDNDNLKDKLDDEREQAIGAREKLMRDLADLADLEEWTENEITAGIAAHAAGMKERNAVLPSSLAT